VKGSGDVGDEGLGGGVGVAKGKARRNIY